MKKIAVFLVCLFAACAMTACSSSSDTETSSRNVRNGAADDAAETDAADDNDVEVTDTDTSEAEETQPEETKADATHADETEPEQTEAEAEATQPPTDTDDSSTPVSGFERGTVDGQVYTSEFAGLRFTAPDGWEYASEEEILAIMGLGVEAVGADDMVLELMKLTTIYDAQAADPETGMNLTIMYENIPAYGLDPASFTEEQYAESVKEITTGVDGITYTYSEPEYVTLGGGSYLKLTATGYYEIYGMQAEQAMYFRRIGDFMMSIIVSSGLDTADPASLESCFSAL